MSRPSDLTEELTLQIRSEVLKGTLYKDIQSRLDIPDNTWDAWVYKDYKDFRKNLNSWKSERLIKKSERLSEEILDIKHLNDEGQPNTDVLRVKQKESEFIRSTLGKNQGYSSRSELTGADGEKLDLGVVILPKRNEYNQTKSEEDSLASSAEAGDSTTSD